MHKVLLVEDEAHIRKFVVLNMKKENFQVEEASTGTEALASLKKNTFDIVLLDINVPEVDGYEICQYIRKNASSTGIIMLTAMGTDMDKLMAFEYGADDYIVKPFNPLEVIARMKALLRRTGKNPQTEEPIIIKFVGLEINLSTRGVLKYDKEIHLTPKEYELLRLFAENTQKIFTREDILDRLWGKDFIGEENTVDVHIRRLREKIEDSTKSPVYIKTSWGIGYQWGGSSIEV